MIQRDHVMGRAVGGGRVLARCLAVLVLAWGCAAPAADPELAREGVDGRPGVSDPARAEVPLPAAPGWQASLVLDNGEVGIWTVGTCKAFPHQGCPEVFGLDDRGRCHLMSSYSGKWTPHATVEDGAWLGALCQLDLDPMVPGPEIYTGGRSGNLYQIVPHREGGFDSRIVARHAAEEIHTLVGGELLPSRSGLELLAFTALGRTYAVEPDGAGGLTSRFLTDLAARVRQALLLPHRDGERPWIAAVCRSGEVLLLRLTEDGLERRVILREAMGFGRCALRPGADPDAPQVLYVTRDDGVVLRLEGRPDGTASWTRELVYAGPQGPRGVAAGRFHEDPAVETVAVFGYSSRVQLLSRRPGEAWAVTTLFVDRDKGHWLETVELDGRNATDELIASGYGGRIVLLARVPGTGLEGVPTDPDGPPRPEPPSSTGSAGRQSAGSMPSSR
jgi:hypothetical protein